MPRSYTRQDGWKAVEYVPHPCLDEGMGHLAQVYLPCPKEAFDFSYPRLSIKEGAIVKDGWGQM